MIVWVFIIYNTWGGNLDHAIIDLRKSETIYGMVLVDMSCVNNIKHFWLITCSLESLSKVNQSNSLHLIIENIRKPDTKADITKQIFNGICNHINKNKKLQWWL